MIAYNGNSKIYELDASCLSGALGQVHKQFMNEMHVSLKEPNSVRLVISLC